MGIFGDSEKDILIKKLTEEKRALEWAVNEYDSFLRKELGIKMFQSSIPYSPNHMLYGEEETLQIFDAKRYAKKYNKLGIEPTTRIANILYDLRKSKYNISAIKSSVNSNIILWNLIELELKYALIVDVAYDLLKNHKKIFLQAWQDTCMINYSIDDDELKSILFNIIKDSSDFDHFETFRNSEETLRDFLVEYKESDGNDDEYHDYIEETTSKIYLYYQHKFAGCYKNDKNDCELGLDKNECTLYKNEAENILYGRDGIVECSQTDAIMDSIEALSKPKEYDDQYLDWGEE